MMTEEEFQRISSYVKQNYGIDMHEKKEIVRGRLENHIREGGFQNFHDFMNAVENDKTGTQEKMLVNLLTTNYTYFMREFEHFEYLKQYVLPWIREKEANIRELRGGCGAASTGEEPYMLAMVLADYFALERQDWDTRILATDISTRVLEQALAGVYKAEQLKSVPDKWKKQFFLPLAGGTQYQVKPEWKKQVIFRKFNLMDSFPFKKKMHFVFLRNVLIYFDAPTKKEILRKVYDFMEPGGYLFIGLTETLDRGMTQFNMIKPSIFRKEG